MVGGFIYFDTPIDTSVIEADISDLQSEMATKVTQGGDDTGAFPLEVGTKTAQPFVITTNLLARIRVLANGRTLVQKTTDTGEALQVGGTVQADTVNSPKVGTTTAEDAKFCANNVEGLRIFNATRNISIGVALDSGDKLYVNGTVKSSNAFILEAVGAITKNGSNIDASGAWRFNSANETFVLNPVLAGSGNTSNDVRLIVARSGTGANQTISDYTQRYAVWGAGQTPRRRFSSKSFEFWTDSTGSAWNAIFANRMFLINETGQIWAGFDNGATAPHASAKMQIDSNSQGFAPPRMTTADRILIASPLEGLMVYDTTLKTYCFYDGTAWRKISHSLA